MPLEAPKGIISRSLRRGAGKVVFNIIGKGLQVEGISNIPQLGPAILAFAPHVSPFDPFAIGAVSHRMPETFGKKEAFEIPFLGQVLTAMGGIPLDRGNIDRRAVNLAIGVLIQGDILMASIEGTRFRGRREEVQLQQARSGVVYVAQKAAQELGFGIPIIPVAIWGLEGAFRLIDIKEASRKDRFGLTRQEVNISFGEPIIIDPVQDFMIRQALRSEQRQLKADQIGYAIADMLPERYMGYYSESRLN